MKRVAFEDGQLKFVTPTASVVTAKKEGLSPGDLDPKMRKRMGDYAPLFERVNKGVLSKAVPAVADAIAKEMESHGGELKQKIKDEMGNRGITEVSEFVSDWAVSLASEILNYAVGTAAEKASSEMTKHFPAPRAEGEEEEQKQASIPTKTTSSSKVVAASKATLTVAYVPPKVESKAKKDKTTDSKARHNLQTAITLNKVAEVLRVSSKSHPKAKAMIELAGKAREIASKIKI